MLTGIMVFLFGATTLLALIAAFSWAIFGIFQGSWELIKQAGSAFAWAVIFAILTIVLAVASESARADALTDQVQEDQCGPSHRHYTSVLQVLEKNNYVVHVIAGDEAIYKFREAWQKQFGTSLPLADAVSILLVDLNKSDTDVIFFGLDGCTYALGHKSTKDMDAVWDNTTGNKGA